MQNRLQTLVGFVRAAVFVWNVPSTSMINCIAWRAFWHCRYTAKRIVASMLHLDIPYPQFWLEISYAVCALHVTCQLSG